MRVVIDTNVVFSALYRPESQPGQLLLMAAEGQIELFAPATVRDELEGVLRRKLDYSDEQWGQTLDALPVRWIEPAEYTDFLAQSLDAIRDATDAPLVAVALLLRTGVVSGDRDFHPLKQPVVPTWKPREAVARPKRKSGLGSRRRRKRPA